MLWVTTNLYSIFKGTSKDLILASRTSLGNLLSHHCYSKELLPISDLNIPSFSMKSIQYFICPCAITSCFCKKSLPSSLVCTIKYWKAARRFSLQAEPHLSQPVFTGEVLQPPDHLCGPPWTCSNRSILEPQSWMQYWMQVWNFHGLLPPRFSLSKRATQATYHDWKK